MIRWILRLNDWERRHWRLMEDALVALLILVTAAIVFGDWIAVVIAEWIGSY